MKRKGMKKKENEKKICSINSLVSSSSNKQAIYIQSLLFCLADNFIGKF
jgi:hypothetical protein